MSERGTPAARSRRLLTGISIVADVSALVAVLAVDSRTIIVIIAALALLAGLYILISGWGAIVDRRVLLGIAGVVAGASTLSAVYVPDPGGGTPDPDPTPTNTGSPSPPPSPDPNPDPVPTPSPDPVPTGTGKIANASVQVRLEEGMGANVDGSGKSVIADGPNGDIDLYYGRVLGSGSLRANGSDFAYDYGTDTDAHQRCSRANSQAITMPEININTLMTGDQLCFHTSDGHVAWTRVNDRAVDYLVLNVTVWRD